MAIYSNTLSQLVEKTARLFLKDFWSGTATSAGSTTTIIDSARFEEEDFFNSLPYAEIYVNSSTRKITDFANSTGTITFSPALSASTEVGDTYSVHSRYKRAEIVDAINMAIEEVAEEALFWDTNETVELVTSTYQYDLPTDFMYIWRVTMAGADGTFYDPSIPQNQYYIIPGGTPKLAFYATNSNLQPSDWSYTQNTFGIVDGRALRIEGLVSPDTLSLDTDVCPISPNFLGLQAAAYLTAAAAMEGKNDSEALMAYSKILQSRADIERQKTILMDKPMNLKRVRE